MRILLASLAAITLLLAGCSAAPGGGGDASQPLRVGMELAYPPFETKDDAGNPTGVSVDLATALAESLGRPVQIENIAWDGLIPSLQSGKVDVVISSMTITEERGKVVDFSDPYAKAYLAFLVGPKSSAKSVADLDSPDRTIAVKKGTSGEIWVRANLPQTQVTALSSENAAVTEVVQGKADAFIYDQLTIYRQAQQNPGSTMVPIPDQAPQEWGAAVRKGNTELLESINKFFADYRANGGFEKLTQKYLAQEKATFDEQGFPWFFG